MIIYYYENKVIYSLVKYTKSQLKAMEKEYGKYIKTVIVK